MANLGTQTKQIVRLLLTAAAGGSIVAMCGAAGSLRRLLHDPEGYRPLVVERVIPENARPRMVWDSSGYGIVYSNVQHWRPEATLVEVRDTWRVAVADLGKRLDELSETTTPSTVASIDLLLSRASLLNSRGDARAAYATLDQARREAQAAPQLAAMSLSTIVFAQGVTAMRIGENENCVDCGCGKPSSCILPIDRAAVHVHPEGSRLAIRHFTEYLLAFPDDLEVRWLLNVAHMTLGEYPDRVDPRYRIPLDRFESSEHGIGRFTEISRIAGIDRINEAGGAIMEDLDGDGWLDLVVTSIDPAQNLAIYRNLGNGRFEDRSAAAGVAGQLGGLCCVQADYDNDGAVDILIVRGAWLHDPIRPSLLHNDGHGRFTDVTVAVGLSDPVNANSAQWADYDNDGRLDLFIGCEAQPNHLYHARADGTFVDVAQDAGVAGTGGMVKGCAWIDYDNDGFPDLFTDGMTGEAQLYHNRRDGTFTSANEAAGIDGPRRGFSCWAFDYDNDGWLDLFATCYDRTLADIVRGIVGEPHGSGSSRLYRNRGGTGFEDVTKQVGLDLVFATMGSNFADFDRDGYLDMYLATGDPMLSTLVPNRMLRNLHGERFVDITASSGTGHLQKGHGVACGDFDRDGDVDLFVETGGAVEGDRFHDLLFRNPAYERHSVTLSLVGRQTNRSSIGARIELVTAGAEPLTVHRHVSSGSSFGGNPLEQTIGLGDATRIARLEVHWPTSGTTQVFTDVPVDHRIVVTEFAASFETQPQRPAPPAK